MNASLPILPTSVVGKPCQDGLVVSRATGIGGRKNGTQRRGLKRWIRRWTSRFSTKSAPLILVLLPTIVSNSNF